jgi:hypothetical protein
MSTTTLPLAPLAVTGYVVTGGDTDAPGYKLFSLTNLRGAERYADQVGGYASPVVDLLGADPDDRDDVAEILPGGISDRDIEAARKIGRQAVGGMLTEGEAAYAVIELLYSVVGRVADANGVARLTVQA